MSLEIALWIQQGALVDWAAWGALCAGEGVLVHAGMYWLACFGAGKKSSTHIPPGTPATWLPLPASLPCCAGSLPVLQKALRLKPDCIAVPEE